jgi:hypothetical protein
MSQTQSFVPFLTFPGVKIARSIFQLAPLFLTAGHDIISRATRVCANCGSQFGHESGFSILDILENARAGRSNKPDGTSAHKCQHEKKRKIVKAILHALIQDLETDFSDALDDTATGIAIAKEFHTMPEGTDGTDRISSRLANPARRLILLLKFFLRGEVFTCNIEGFIGQIRPEVYIRSAVRRALGSQLEAPRFQGTFNGFEGWTSSVSKQPLMIDSYDDVLSKKLEGTKHEMTFRLRRMNRDRMRDALDYIFKLIPETVNVTMKYPEGSDIIQRLCCDFADLHSLVAEAENAENDSYSYSKPRPIQTPLPDYSD